MKLHLLPKHVHNLTYFYMRQDIEAEKESDALLHFEFRLIWNNMH